MNVKIIRKRIWSVPNSLASKKFASCIMGSLTFWVYVNSLTLKHGWSLMMTSKVTGLRWCNCQIFSKVWKWTSPSPERRCGCQRFAPGPRWADPVQNRPWDPAGNPERGASLPQEESRGGRGSVSPDSMTRLAPKILKTGFQMTRITMSGISIPEGTRQFLCMV